MSEISCTRSVFEFIEFGGKMLHFNLIWNKNLKNMREREQNPDRKIPIYYNAN